MCAYWIKFLCKGRSKKENLFSVNIGLLQKTTLIPSCLLLTVPMLSKLAKLDWRSNAPRGISTQQLVHWIFRTPGLGISKKVGKSCAQGRVRLIKPMTVLASGLWLWTQITKGRDMVGHCWNIWRALPLTKSYIMYHAEQTSRRFMKKGDMW